MKKKKKDKYIEARETENQERQKERQKELLAPL